MIVRSPRPDRYAIIANETLRDSRLSFRARGLLAYLLSMPDNWQTSSERISRETTEGRDAIRAALRELETIGYVARIRSQSEDGRWKSELVVWDQPDPTARLVCKPVEKSESYPLPKTDNQSSVIQSSIEQPSKKHLERKSATYSGSNPRICGQCDGTGWTTGPSSKLTRCACGDGIVS